MSDIERANEARRLYQLLKPYFAPFTAANSGSWTPVLAGATIAGTLSYSAQIGSYTRLGNVVFFRGIITLSAVTAAPTGALRINGLPIAAATSAGATLGAAHFSHWNGFNLGGAAVTYLGGWIQSAQSRIDLVTSPNAGGSAVFITGATAAVAIGTSLSFAGHYQV